MAGIFKESRARAHPLISGRIVVAVAVAVDIAHVGRGTAHDGTQPPIAVRNGKRHVMPPLANVVFGVGVERVCGHKVVNDASRCFRHRDGKHESV